MSLLSATQMIAALYCLPRKALQTVVKAYRLLLSPSLGSACRFNPSCSIYALDALEKHGACWGTYLTLGRLARCNPWCEGGEDAVPCDTAKLAPVKIFTRLRGLSTGPLEKKKLL